MYNNTGNEYAYAGMNIPISSANIDGTGLMLNERVKYACKSSMVLISTANSGLDGSGTLGVLLTSSTNNGDFIKRITIKARGTTTQGMIRLFIQTTGAAILIKEIEVPAVIQSATDETFVAEINEYFYMVYGSSLRVSTEKPESYVIFVDAVDMSYPT
jgi:hypothetical protein